MIQQSDLSPASQMRCLTFIVQNDFMICNAVRQKNERFAMSLFHRQLIRGVPSFYIDGVETLLRFMRGFQFGEYAKEDYVFYCTMMRNTYTDNMILTIFNVPASERETFQKIGLDKPALLP